MTWISIEPAPAACLTDMWRITSLVHVEKRLQDADVRNKWMQTCTSILFWELILMENGLCVRVIMNCDKKKKLLK